MKGDWEKVFTTVAPHEAYLVQGRLEAAGIHAVVMNNRDQSYTTFGELHVYVSREHVLKAINLLERNAE